MARTDMLSNTAHSLPAPDHRDGVPSHGGLAPTDGAGQGAREEIVEDGWAGQRLDNYLMRCVRGVPKSLVYRWIRTGQVRINGGRTAPDLRLATGDRIRLPPFAREAMRQRQAQDERHAQGHRRLALDRALAADWAQRIRIVHEDAALLVVDKPPGLAVHGGSGVAAGLVEQMRALRPHERHLELVHRLDRDTSGLVMLARRPSALRALQQALAQRQVDKTYVAAVAGDWTQQGWSSLRFPLLRTVDARGERRMLVSAEGLASRTDVRCMRSFLTAQTAGLPMHVSLLQCRLYTGRTHQIRVHLAHTGHPLLGDARYGDFALNRLLHQRGVRRMFLHAAYLRLQHPDTGQVLELSSPVPFAFEQLETQLTMPSSQDG